MKTVEEQGVCTATNWNVRPAEESVVAGIAAATGLSRQVARVLVARGVTTPSAAQAFLEPDLARDWADPFEIPGMGDAVEALADALAAGTRIVVFGDFDLDGISSAAVAARGLAVLGADVRAIVPNRFRDGYGLTAPSIDRLLSMDAGLVLTVDCGISSASEVEELLRRGVSVVVTDHHEPGGGVPAGIPVVNPKLDDACSSGSLAGAGVALKLIDAVGGRLGFPELWRSLADLATLGTVADVVPLTGENRALVAEGIAAIRREPRVCISALCAVAGVSCDTFNTDSISFALAPRLNAPGRMSDPHVALDLLMTDDPRIAEEAALALDEQNRERQRIESDLTEAAEAMAEREFRPGERALVVAGEGWHQGVKGIVASRLAASFGVPAIVFAVDGEEAQGSGRSVGKVDLFAAVSGCADTLIRFGGHAAAVGVTLATRDLPRFRESLAARLADVPRELFEGVTVVDSTMGLSTASVELAAELDLLEPFGHGNPRPLFSASGVFMNGRQRVGRTGTHLRFTAYDGTTSVPAIAFRCAEIERYEGYETAVDLAFQLVADEWRGRRRVQLHVREIMPATLPDTFAPAAALVEDLFARADQTLVREEYAGIADADSFHTKLAGVTFEGRQEVLERLEPGTPLRPERQPDNPFDANAIALIEPRGEQVGFFNRRLAAVLAPVIDTGLGYDIEVSEVTGGTGDRSRGVNVLVTRRDLASDAIALERSLERRAQLTALSPASVESELVRHFIGDRCLHDAQRRSLEALGRGKSCLAVMATGRGKSLIFHLHAARIALLENAASVFVFPLRALVADQAFHLQEAFAEIGLSVTVLTGESAQGARDETFAALRDRSVDVVLTTPEFLDHHASRFAGAGRVGFVVIDEAHHIGSARAGHRPAYGRLDQALEALGRPVVLATTATADTGTAAAIREILGIEAVIIDPTVRENLLVEDRREAGGKDEFLVSLVGGGEKTIVYVNSRDQSVRLARMMRKRLPERAMRTAFYNGGLAREARHAVERAFRAGDIDVVVATSAFGEGVNIPDIRHVVLYHLPFNDIEFNQMSGRAGRDGAVARVHLLFGSGDGRINEMVLAGSAPPRDDMAALYRVLEDVQSLEGPGFEITNSELAERAKRACRGVSLTDKGVSSAIGVFRELGLVDSEGHGAYRRLSVSEKPSRKLDLMESVRYAESIRETECFREFRVWALDATHDALLIRFNRPILPGSRRTGSE